MSEELFPYMTLPCVGCGEQHIVNVVPSELDAWQRGGLIQRAMPSLSEEDREMMISGTCAPCWEKMFSEDE
jgi:hypothetical protein